MGKKRKEKKLEIAVMTTTKYLMYVNDQKKKMRDDFVF